MELPKSLIFINTLKPGGAFLYRDNEFPDKPHFFVIINAAINAEQPLYLVCATSQVEKKRQWANQVGINENTLVIVQPKDCPFLKKETVFNCNEVKIRSIEVIKEKIDNNQIIKYDEISLDLLNKLRAAVKNSRLIKRVIKKSI